MIELPPEIDKISAFQTVHKYIQTLHLHVKKKDERRPWGGFFVIDESSLKAFIDQFFPEFDQINNGQNRILSPKILLVEPGKRLSWQYHYRRSELWKIINGPVGIILSDDDNQSDIQTFKTGDLVTIDKGQRHRLVGLENWGIVAEIWQHTDPSNPSDEEDIVRLKDDFGR